MDNLPVDLKLTILKSVDDIVSLLALSRTCRTMYALFDSPRNSMLSSVLEHVLPHEIRYEAIAVIKSAKLVNPAKEDVLRFLEEQLFARSGDAALTEVGLPELARQHILVEWFTHDLCATVKARRLLDTGVNIEPFGLSTTERIRIHRAFYRFQLYCNLFSITNPRRLEDYYARDAFFARFPTWEVEEFACIQDYLHGRLDIMDEVTLHDLTYACKYERIAKDFREPNRNKEHYISLGLGFLHSVFTAQTYDQRQTLFRENLGTEYDGIDMVLSLLHENDSLPQNVVHRTQFTYANSPNDSYIWSKSNNTENPNYCIMYYEYFKADLREWCYCFWDARKLRDWHAIDEEWNYQDHRDWAANRQAEWTRKHELYHRTYADRTDSASRGITGYWEPDPETIYRWQPPPPPTRGTK
ncbi:hypothetical protein MMC11_000737 [Xylographa trunciseda]|nr:hypothetical protein [Xylographa trunciseda]